ncbi:hypothetical protein CTI12_AA504110 [Artemisia annua]|uniref:Homologous recombination OB-fold protein OB-fold domain-containing protein n=1 Tax=Artemisia annua TaxID=35608 RepID=A0A2U1LD69_ARTAN|nr:hypothetical protein CTI12_AA504110 [Artemisia annua]
MNSMPDLEWEQLLDIDDSDLRLSATTQNRVSPTFPRVANYDENPIRKIPGPAGIVQIQKKCKIADIRYGVDDSVMATQDYIKKVIDDVGEDYDFKSGPWVRTVEYVKADGGIVIGCFADIKKFIKKGKLEKAVAIIKSCTPNVLGDLNVTLKDVSGLISGTIHHKVVDDLRFEKKFTVGAVLILKNVSVFSPKQSVHYLNITIKNVVEVFSKDIVALSSDVGCSGSGFEV